MEPPFILCGLGRVGWRVLEYLQAAGLPVVVIDTRCSPNDPRLKQGRLVKGDCRRSEVLAEAGAAEARGVLVMTNDDLINISTALTIRHLNPSVRIVMRMFNQNMIPRLGKAFQNIYALSTATLTAPLFALSALTGQALGSVRVENGQDGLRQVAELTVTLGSPLRGQSIAAAAERHNMRVLAHRPTGGKDRFLLDVDADARLLPGDRMVVCVEPRDLAPLLDDADPVLANVRWAGWLRRMGRVAWRTLAEMDLSVKVCTGVLLGVILLSTLLLHYEEGNPWHTALSKTVGLMATAGGLDAGKHPWLHFFASGLRLLGAALVAAFTAILTNYLLRARLSGALEFRRIPDGGHVVICGLGNIGFRVVEELVRGGERVVVIEQAKDSRFVSTARRLGVPVLVGDATVSGVLEQAHAARARAVIAATSDDLLNLEVALMVRELNPTQRVVLHLSDPNLAKMLREAANVKLALSIPVLAAPAFVAALFGDRVQNVFMIEGRLLAAVDLLVAAQDPCLTGQSVRAVAIDYGLVPVAVFDDQGHERPQALEVRLAAGYRLVAISALSSLERLLRREPARAEYAVDVTAFPPPARARLAALLGSQPGANAEAAERALEQLPLRLSNPLTRGQAEELVVSLRREQVTASVRPLDGRA